MDKDTEEGRLVHVFTQLNYTSVSSKTPPMPKPNVIIDGMSTSTIFPFIDLMDGFYSIILRERNILRRALITNIVIIYERLMIGLRLCCAASTFKGLIPNRLISMRDFAPSYLNDRFARSLSKDGNSDLEVHRLHFRKTLTLTRAVALVSSSYDVRQTWPRSSRWSLVIQSWCFAEWEEAHLWWQCIISSLLSTVS